MTDFLTICKNNKQVKTAVLKYLEEKKTNYFDLGIKTGNDHYTGAVFATSDIIKEINKQ